MEITPDILKRYHAGECTPEEHAAVETWLQENALPIGDFTPMPSDADMQVSGQTMWHYLDQQLGENLPVELPYTRPLWRRLAPYAAAAMLLFIVGAVLLMTNFTGQRAARIAQADAAYGQKIQLMLTDGTVVYLNSGSTLHYPQQFQGGTREVELTGEAYFEVAKNKTKPFIIKTKRGASVKVVGTAFNVSAYPTAPRVEVAVAEGVVHFMKDSDPRDYVELRRGQRSVYDIMTHAFRDDRDDSALLAGEWRRQRLIFQQVDMTEVIRRLERWYGVDIVVDKSALLQKRYSGQYDNPDLIDLLSNIAFVMNFNYRIDGKTKKITIY